MRKGAGAVRKRPSCADEPRSADGVRVDCAATRSRVIPVRALVLLLVLAFSLWFPAARRRHRGRGRASPYLSSEAPPRQCPFAPGRTAEAEPVPLSLIVLSCTSVFFRPSDDARLPPAAPCPRSSPHSSNTVSPGPRSTKPGDTLRGQDSPP